MQTENTQCYKFISRNKFKLKIFIQESEEESVVNIILSRQKRFNECLGG